MLTYISNGGWLDSNAGAGFRKCLQAEFDEIYVFNLKGNIRAFDKREGENIFDVMVGITILLLVLLPANRHHGNATIHYKDIGDYKDREAKCRALKMYRSFFSPEWLAASTLITPNEHGDWINQRNDTFGSYISLAPERRIDEASRSFFTYGSNGCKSQRDAWCYGFNRERVFHNMGRSIATYNEVLSTGNPCEDPTRISWTRGLRQLLDKKRNLAQIGTLRKTVYRPFFVQWLYYDRAWNELQGVAPLAFPTGRRGENVEICINGIGMNKAFGCFITDITPDIQLMPNGQCFPLHWYSERAQDDLFTGADLVRHDGVSDWALDQARRRYAIAVTKEDLFYYVYGFLHHPTYRATYAADLKKSLPRIPFVETAADFRKVAAIGRALGALHLHYETCEPYPLTEVGTGANPRVEKMAFPGKDKTKVRINDTLTLEGIPREAHDYIVNGRSPIEWVLDRYQVKTDKASGIVNDPNLADPDLLPGIEHGTARALATLIKRLTTLSLESLRLIAQLPPWQP